MPLKQKKNNPALRNINKSDNTVCEKTLNNGVVVISESIPEVKTLAIGFWFLCGARYEKKSEQGISHFVEHMLFKGTKTSTAYTIAADFDRIGGYVNAFSERENLCLHCVVPAEHSEKALTILCDMVENSLFCEKEIQRERRVIENEIISSEDDPEEAAIDSSIQAVWQNHPISSPILGSKKSIKKLTRDAIFAWYTDYIVCGETVVSLAGNVDYPQACAVLEKLKHRKKSDMLRSNDFFSPKWKHGLQFINADFQQEQIFVLYPVFMPVTQNDYYALAILNALIGDTMSSRLFQSLRERDGLCYSVYSFVSMYSDCAYWGAYCATSKKNTPSVIDTIHRELHSLLEKGFDDEEILAAKEHICGEEIINGSDMEHRMKILARNYYMQFRQCTNDEMIYDIRSVCTEKIYDVLRRLIKTEHEALLIYGPPLKSKIEKQIKNNFTAHTAIS